MRSSKSRSRSKPNRPRSLGNVINRVFDSSGPEGKVRGTPQQVIDKYTQLARDAQLSNDRVASENYQQHAEHYIRMLGEATREMSRDQDGRPGGDDQRRDDGYGDQPRGNEVLDLGDGRYNDSGLVETPEQRQQPRNDNRGNENRSNGNRSNDNRGNDNRGNDNRGGDNRGGDNRSNDNRGNDNRGGDNRGGDNRSNDNRGNDNRGNDNRGNDTRSNDTRSSGPRSPQPPREPRPAYPSDRPEPQPRDNAPMMAGLIAEPPAMAAPETASAAPVAGMPVTGSRASLGTQSSPDFSAMAFTRFTKSQSVAGSLNWLAQVA